MEDRRLRCAVQRTHAADTGAAQVQDEHQKSGINSAHTTPTKGVDLRISNFGWLRVARGGRRDVTDATFTVSWHPAQQSVVHST